MNKYTFNINDISDVEQSIKNEGFAIVKDIFTEEEMLKVEIDLSKAIQKETNFHGTNKYKDYAMLLACPIYGGAFVEVLENLYFWKPFNAILDPSCITYVYTSSSMPPNATNYSNRVHVDRPHYNPNMIETLGCLICVNDFTKENGATWVLPKSHLIDTKPDESYFYKNAIQVEASKGSVFYFNLRLWHSGGQNTTNKWRHALGIGMIKPYFKQRIDLPRAIPSKIAEKLSDNVKQKLGYFAQPPTNLEEYYAPLEKRKYKEKSEWDKIT